MRLAENEAGGATGATFSTATEVRSAILAGLIGPGEVTGLIINSAPRDNDPMGGGVTGGNPIFTPVTAGTRGRGDTGPDVISDASNKGDETGMEQIKLLKKTTTVHWGGGEEVMVAFPTTHYK